MRVLVDTSVWSLVFRRKQTSHLEQQTVQQLQALILDGNAYMAGAIRQEILSGIKHSAQYEALKSRLRAFDDFSVTIHDHELAAELYNTCRGKGIQGSHNDFLICAIAINAKVPVFAVDQDFPQYAALIPVELYQPTDTSPRIHEPAEVYSGTRKLKL